MPRFANSLLVCTLVLSGWVGAAAAQDQLAVAERPQQPQGEVEHEPGRYTGVQLGGEQAPPRALKPGRAVVVTWPGFQMRPDGGSCVFVQTTTPINVEPVQRDHKWVVDLGDARVDGTNRLPLDTHYFNTPVTRVELKRSGQHMLLELTVRADVKPRVAQAHSKKGYHFLSLEFVPGQYLPVELSAKTEPNLASSQTSKPSSSPASTRAEPLDISAQFNAPPAPATAAEPDMANELNGELPPGMGPTKPTTRSTVTLGGSGHHRVGQ